MFYAKLRSLKWCGKSLCSYEMYQVSSSLVHARLQTYVKVMNSRLPLNAEEHRFRSSAVFFEAPRYHTVSVTVEL